VDWELNALEQAQAAGYQRHISPMRHATRGVVSVGARMVEQDDCNFEQRIVEQRILGGG